MTTELIDWKEEMKININGYIKNINTNEKQAINSISIYNKNKISYFDNNNKYTIKLPSKDKLILIRENNDILSTRCFKKNFQRITSLVFLLKKIINKYVVS